MTASTTKPSPWRARDVISCSAIVVAGCMLAAAVEWKTSYDASIALSEYRKQADQEAMRHAGAISNSFNQIYQGIRTISFLPSVKAIDRQGSNIDGNARESIIQIYNNLRSNVTISEVYIVPASLDPEKIDPATGSLEVPILMFDDAVAAYEADGDSGDKTTTVAQAESAAEVEIFEYRALKAQLSYFEANYPTEQSVNKLNVPIIGSVAVLTCDNSDFEKTGKDADREGVMLSVPFFGSDGKLKGSVTAVLRTNVLRAMLPDPHRVLVNSTHNIRISPLVDGGTSSTSSFAFAAKPDPELIYSGVHDLNVPDPQSRWIFWTGLPNAAFHKSGNAQAIATFEIMGLLASLVATLSAVVGYLIVARQIRLNQELQELAKQSLEKSLLALAEGVERRVSDAAQSIAAGVGEIHTMASDMLNSASRVSQLSEKSADAISQVQQTTGAIAAATEEMSSSISQIGARVSESTSATEAAVQSSLEARQVISDLSMEIERIADVADLIGSIASQTNLLALNATIEAARAGDAGKGFLVVANEVKQLSNQTAKSTETIRNKVLEIQRFAQAAVAGVQGIDSKVECVAQIAGAISTSISQQIQATQEIAESGSKSARVVDEVASGVTLMSGEADKSGQMAQDLLLLSDRVSTAMQEFQKNITEIVNSSSLQTREKLAS